MGAGRGTYFRWPRRATATAVATASATHGAEHLLWVREFGRLPFAGLVVDSSTFSPFSLADWGSLAETSAGLSLSLWRY